MKILNTMPGIPSNSVWWSNHPVKFFTIIGISVGLLYLFFAWVIPWLWKFKNFFDEELGRILTESFREEKYEEKEK